MSFLEYENSGYSISNLWHCLCNGNAHVNRGNMHWYRIPVHPFCPGCLSSRLWAEIHGVYGFSYVEDDRARWVSFSLVCLLLFFVLLPYVYRDYLCAKSKGRHTFLNALTWVLLSTCARYSRWFYAIWNMPELKWHFQYPRGNEDCKQIYEEL